MTKYVIIVIDGAADLPIPELGNKTPLEYARIPNMDRIALKGRTGLTQTIYPGLPMGSIVANLGILGYNPLRYYPNGRASFEAFSEFFTPFLSESIITARVRDVMPVTMYGRGGETMSGARIFKSGEGGDAFGDQLAKGFIHVVEGITPGASPFRVPVGSNFNDIEFGRFARLRSGRKVTLKEYFEWRG